MNIESKAFLGMRGLVAWLVEGATQVALLAAWEATQEVLEQLPLVDGRTSVERAAALGMRDAINEALRAHGIRHPDQRLEYLRRYQPADAPPPAAGTAIATA